MIGRCIIFTKGVYKNSSLDTYFVLGEVPLFGNFHFFLVCYGWEMYHFMGTSIFMYIWLGDVPIVGTSIFMFCWEMYHMWELPFIGSDNM